MGKNLLGSGQGLHTLIEVHDITLIVIHLTYVCLRIFFSK